MKVQFYREWRLLLFGFLMTLFTLPGQTIFISLFSGFIRTEIVLTHGEFGGLYSMATLLSAVFLLWSGTFTDKTDLRLLSVIIIVGLACTCLFMAITYRVEILFVLLFFLRQFGQGLMAMCAITALVRYLPEIKGKANALGSMGYSFGEAIVPFIVSVGILSFGWRMTWTISGLSLLVITLPLVFILLKGQTARHANYKNKLKDNENDHVKSLGIRQWSRRQVIRDIGFYIVVPGLMCHSFLYTGFFFHQVHLLEVKNWELQPWTGLLFTYSIVSIGTMLLVGILIDRIGTYKLLPVPPFLICMGLGVLIVVKELETAISAIVLIGLSSGFNAAVIAPFWLEAYGSRYLGSIKSLSYSLMVLFSSISPFVIGKFLDIGLHMETVLKFGVLYSFCCGCLSLIGAKRFIKLG